MTRSRRLSCVLPLVAAGSLGACDPERGVLTIAGDDARPDTDVADTDLPDTPDDTGADDLDTAGCSNPLLQLTPQDGAADVHLGARISAWTTTFESEAGLRIRTAGADVPGRVVPVSGTSLLAWEPLAMLRAGTPYEAAFSWSCGTASASWTTATDTFRLRLGEARLQAPTGDLPFETAVGDLLVRLDGFGVGRVEWLGAPMQGDAQDLCAPTFVAGGGVRPDRGFAAVAASATVRIGAVRAGAVGLRVEGDLDAARPDLDVSEVAMTLRVDDLAAGLGGLDGDAICDAAGTGCQRCTQGTGECVTFRWTGVPVSVAASEVGARSAADVAASPACP